MSHNPSQTFWRRRWKVILNIITILALVVLVYAIREQLAQTLRDLARVRVWPLLLMVVLQFLNYHSQTKLYQGLFAVVGNRLKYKFLFKISLELNFVNHVFPSGGVSGISYFGMRMRSRDITASRATLVQIMKVGLQILSFEVLLIAGLLFMAIGNRVNDVVIMFTTALSTLMVIGTILFVKILGSEQRIRTTFTWLTRGLNRLIHVVRRRHPETIRVRGVEDTILDLHRNYKLIESQYKKLKWTFFWALMANLTEIFTIYAVYIAFGKWVNLGAVILAYAVANFAGLVSVLPGGVGIYEALMTGVLAAAGVPAALSLPVTVMYRVINTIIQLPIGYYFYHQTLTRGESTKGDA